MDMDRHGHNTKFIRLFFTVRKETLSMLRWLEREATNRHNIEDESLSFSLERDSVTFKIQKKTPNTNNTRNYYEENILFFFLTYIETRGEEDSQLSYWPFTWAEKRLVKKVMKRIFDNYQELHLTHFYEFTERYKAAENNFKAKQ